MATVLTIIQNAAAEIGVPVGTTISATDKTMVRMKSLLNRTGKNLRRQATWAECLKRYTFDLATGVYRYDFPVDWDSWANETIWNQDDSRMLLGPLSPREYEWITNGVSVAVADQRFRVRGITKGIDIVPTPTADETGQTVVYEYFSKNWLRPTNKWTDATVYAAGAYVYYVDNIYKTTAGGTSGVTPPTHMTGSASDGAVTWEYVTYENLTADTDVALLDEEVLTLGLIYRFLDGKGIMAEKYEVEYQRELHLRIGQTIGGRTLDMVGNRGSVWASKENNMPSKITL